MKTAQPPYSWDPRHRRVRDMDGVCLSEESSEGQMANRPPGVP